MPRERAPLVGEQPGRTEDEHTSLLRVDAFCTPADVDGAGTRTPAVGLTCYESKDASGQPKFPGAEVTGESPFGSHVTALVKGDALCVRSQVTPGL